MLHVYANNTITEVSIEDELCYNAKSKMFILANCATSGISFKAQTTKEPDKVFVTKHGTGKPSFLLYFDGKQTWISLFGLGIKPTSNSRSTPTEVKKLMRSLFQTHADPRWKWNNFDFKRNKTLTVHKLCDIIEEYRSRPKLLPGAPGRFVRYLLDAQKQFDAEIEKKTTPDYMATELCKLFPVLDGEGHEDEVVASYNSGNHFGCTGKISGKSILERIKQMGDALKAIYHESNGEYTNNVVHEIQTIQTHLLEIKKKGTRKCSFHFKNLKVPSEVKQQIRDCVSNMKEFSQTDIDAWARDTVMPFNAPKTHKKQKLNDTKKFKSFYRSEKMDMGLVVFWHLRKQIFHKVATRAKVPSVFHA